MGLSIKTSLALAFSIAFSPNALAGGPPPPQVTTVAYAGSDYELTTSYVNYDSSSTLLESQPWWGDSTLAGALAQLVQYDLGDYYGSYPPSGSGPAALFAYGTQTGYVSIQYWATPSVIYCPSGCPLSGDYYSYVIATSVTSGVTIEDLSRSILSADTGINSTLTNTNLMLHGAHSRPLSRRVAVGEKTIWAAGDWSRDDHGSRNGYSGLAEIGGGYNYGPVQLNLSAGYTSVNQSLSFNGDVEVEGQYVMAEAIVPISDNKMYATISAYSHSGNADIKRGYLVSSTQNYSNGQTDTQIYGLRARIDYENLFTLNSTKLTPYADVAHSIVNVDAYTELDGSNPIAFNNRDDEITELRVGINGTTSIEKYDFDLISSLEVAHRLQSNTSGVSGSLGSLSFNMDSEDYEQTWLKGGVGVEGLLGAGKASMMLNATTEGEAPSAWIAASWQAAF